MAHDPDSLYQEALAAIDDGDTGSLSLLIDQHPQLATERLYQPGQWLREVAGTALDTFFKDPYLLWFIAEDVPRKNKLPPNIASLASIIIQKAKKLRAKSVQEQLDYTLRLVAWSRVAHESKVQLSLIKLLIDEGANTAGVANDALVNGHFEAAQYIIDMGGELTLPVALCLGKWDEAIQLQKTAGHDQQQYSLILAALNGQADAIKMILRYDGIQVDAPSPLLYSHAPALHHAVVSGSLDAVKCLVEAGAKLDIRDTIYNGTPLDWAIYGGKKEIEGFLRQAGG